MSKPKRKSKIIYVVCMVLLICIFVGCAIYLVKYFWESHESEEMFDELKTLIVEDDSSIDRGNEGKISSPSDSSYSEQKIEYIDIDGVMVSKKFGELYKRNKDFIGWLTINDTCIDYPVMQSMYEEEFYIHKDFDGQYSAAGTLFTDTSSYVDKPSDNILIYGHNMNSGKMFHSLINYEKEDFYKAHKFIQFDTIYDNGIYEVIAAFRTQIYDAGYEGFKYYTFFDAKDETEFEEYISNCKALTPYSIDATATYGDKLITLSTCAYHTSDGRYVVVAKKIK